MMRFALTFPIPRKPHTYRQPPRGTTRRAPHNRSSDVVCDVTAGMDSQICRSMPACVDAATGAVNVQADQCLCASAAAYGGKLLVAAISMRSIRDQDIPSSNLGAPTTYPHCSSASLRDDPIRFLCPRVAQGLGGHFRQQRIVIDLFQGVRLRFGRYDRKDFQMPVVIIRQRLPNAAPLELCAKIR